MPKILAVADDLTGALDTGVQFAKRGAGVLVMMTGNARLCAFDAYRSGMRASCDDGNNEKRTSVCPDYIFGKTKTNVCTENPKTNHTDQADDKPNMTGDCAFFTRDGIKAYDVLVIDAETRRLPPAQAAERIYALTRAALRNGYAYFYKKTDSALRGNIGAEISAMVTAAADFDAEAAAGAYAGTEAEAAAQDAEATTSADARTKAEAAAPDVEAATGADARTESDAAVGAFLGAKIEIAAAPDMVAVAAFAPAYPDSGRITAGGIHYINGTPLADSVFASDPYEPVKHSEVARILAEQTDMRVVSIPTDVYRNAGNGIVPINRRGGEIVSNVNTEDNNQICNRRGGDNVSGDICADRNSAWRQTGFGSGTKDTNTDDDTDGGGPYRIHAGGAIEIYDAESNDDLAMLGRYLKSRGRLRLLAGCAGFAAALPELYGIGRSAGSPPPRHTPTNAQGSRGVLLVSGSVNPITLKQLERAENEGFYVIKLMPEQKLGLERTAAVDEIIATAAARLRANGRVAVAAAVSPADAEATNECARLRGIPPADLRGLISKNIGQFAAGILKRYAAGALAAFGGDTLYEILNQTGISAISPIRELSPGIVESGVISGQYAFRLITKSGGLGGDGAIAEIISYLNEEALII